MPRRIGIVVKHLHHFQRKFAQVLDDTGKLFQHIIGDGDDMTAGGVGLEDIQKLARARDTVSGAVRGQVA